MAAYTQITALSAAQQEAVDRATAFWSRETGFYRYHRKGPFLYKVLATVKKRICVACFEMMGMTSAACKTKACPGHQTQDPEDIYQPASQEVTVVPDDDDDIPEVTKAVEALTIYSDEPLVSEDTESKEESDDEDAYYSGNSEDSDSDESIDENDMIDIELKTKAVHDFKYFTRWFDSTFTVDIKRMDPYVCDVLERAYPNSFIVQKYAYENVMNSKSIVRISEYFRNLLRELSIIGSDGLIKESALIQMLMIVGPILQLSLPGIIKCSGIGHNASFKRASVIYICIVDIRGITYDAHSETLTVEVICKAGKSKDPKGRSNTHYKTQFVASKANKESYTFDPNMYPIYTGDEDKAEELFLSWLKSKHNEYAKPLGYCIGPGCNSNEIFCKKLNITRYKLPKHTSAKPMFKLLHLLKSSKKSRLDVQKTLCSIPDIKQSLFDYCKNGVLKDNTIMSAFYCAALSEYPKLIQICYQVIYDITQSLYSIESDLHREQTVSLLKTIRESREEIDRLHDIIDKHQINANSNPL